MYDISHHPPAPVPLNFNTPRHADSMADALGPDAFPHGQSNVPVLDTAALLTEIGLSDRAVREALARSSAPGLGEWGAKPPGG